MERGRHGLLITGHFYNGNRCGTYIPWELPPTDEIEPWYGFSHRTKFTLSNGLEVGDVSFRADDSRRVIVEEYDKEWQRTIGQIRAEETGG